MNNVVNREIDTWQRPWMVESFNDLYNRDERFFSILIKGVLGWLTENIILYNKPIKHFIPFTGSSYMYIENNGYEFSWKETSGEDTIYMQMPRCVVEIGAITLPQEELTSPYVRMLYERKNTKTNNIEGFNAETRRLPLELSLSCHYVLANMNESLILTQELIDKIVFQKYFYILYLGNTIQCSIEFPSDVNIQINKIDMSSADVNQKTIDLDLKICSSYPIINERSEISNSAVINNLDSNIYDYNNKLKSYKTIDIDKLHI